jgi:hypothetical protein
MTFLKIIEKLQPSWNCQLYLLSLLLTTKPTETHSFPNKHIKRPKESPKLLTLLGDPSRPPVWTLEGGRR